MSTTEYQLTEAIHACQRRIADAERALAKAQSNGRDLATFVSEFQRRAASMGAAQQHRDSTWSAPGVREETVRSLAGLRAAMQQRRADDQGYVARMSSQQAQLAKAVQTNASAVTTHGQTLERERAELQRLRRLMETLQASQAGM